MEYKYFDQYQTETLKLFHRRLVAGLWFGFIFFPLFGILDLVLAPEQSGIFFIYRIAGMAGFLILLLLSYRDFGRLFPYQIAIIGYLIAGTILSFMCVRLSGFGSYHFMGIIIVLVAYAAILPLDVWQCAKTGLLLLIIYCGVIFVFKNPGIDHLKLFLNDIFFFVCFYVISMVKCTMDSKARAREFRLRTKLDSLTEQLASHAQNLEVEVDRRARALEESEFRYRDLYDNIIDMVILINTEKNIQMANPRFYECLKIAKNESLILPFLSIVHPEDRHAVEKQMLPRLLAESDLNDIQFRICSRDDVTINVECNAHLIKKNDKIIGCQMVVRDITVRKQLENDLLESYRNAANVRSAAIVGLAKLAEYRDEATGAHLERIREYALIIARELARMPAYQNYITPVYIDDIYSSSILHDIGKVGVPDSILLKPGKLTATEFEAIKRHSTLGGDALKAVEAQVEGESFLTLGKEIAYFHHEKWDGSGYPKGLKGHEIPLSARIVALADVYDALTSARPYKEAFSHDKAREIILSGSGQHFDPDIVDVFLRHEKEFQHIREELLGDD